MPTRKNRKQSFKSSEKGDVKGKGGNASTHDGRTALGKEFPTQSRDLGPRIVKLRK